MLFSVFRATYRQLEKLVAFCRIMPDLGAHVVLVERLGRKEITEASIGHSGE